MDPSAMMTPMGFAPGMVGGMNPGFVNPQGSLVSHGAQSPHGAHFVMEKAFPVVRLRGLPFNAAEFDVLEFFSGLETVDVVIVRRDGRTTGEAYVVFSNPMQMDFALQKNRASMGRRYVEVFRAKKMEYYVAVANAVMHAHNSETVDQGGMGIEGMRGNGVENAYVNGMVNPYEQMSVVGGAVGRRGDGTAGAHGNPPTRSQGQPPLPRGGPPVSNAGAPFGPKTGVLAPHVEHTGVLKLRGLPFSATKDDIVDFFNGAGDLELAPLVHDSIHVVASLDGRPSGVAFVEFGSPQEAMTAMARDRSSMGTRYVELFASSREEATRAATSGR
jgi:heterogeneous nuclear ribonucleoprotein F/H